MRITEQIKLALKGAVDSAGNRNQLALKMGVPQSHVARWLDGVTKCMDDDMYEKIYPYISQYLSESEALALTGNARPSEASETQKYISALEQLIALLEKHVALLEKTEGMKT